MSQITDYHELSAKISRLKRRPTIERVFTMWHEEISAVLEPTTANKISKIFMAHILIDERESIRIDKLNPLLTQKIFLDKALSEQKYTTVCSICTQLSAMCNFAVASGIISYNPLSTIKDLPQVRKAFKEAEKNQRHRYSFPCDRINPSIKKLFKDYHLFENERCRILLELSFHLLLRPGEMVKITRQGCNYAQNELMISHTKTFKEFYIPLNDTLSKLLKMAERHCGNEIYIFGSPQNKIKPNAHLSSQVMNASLKRCGYKGILHAHGIRGTFSTWASLHPSKIDYISKEAMLQHLVTGKVERVYRHDRHFFAYRKKSHKVWSEYLVKTIGENSVLCDPTLS